MNITTARTTLYWGDSENLGFQPIKKRIVNNNLKLKLTGLTDTRTYQWVVKANPKLPDTKANSADTFTLSGATEYDLDIELAGNGDNSYILGETYYFALQDTTDGQEEIQVSFTIAEEAVLSNSTTTVNNLLRASASDVTYDNAGTNISATNVQDAITELDSEQANYVAYTGATGDVDLGVHGITVNDIVIDNYSDYASITAPAFQEGRLWYDSDTKSLSYYDNNSGTSIQIGKELVVRVRNVTGSTITNGSVVYVTGATGNRPTIALALANAEATSKLIGVATHDIANNSDGKVTVFGLVNDLDTSAYPEGSILYLSSSVAGQLTVTPPASPNFVVEVGVVTVINPTNGTILIEPKQVLSNNNSLGTSQTVAPTQNAVKTYVDNQNALDLKIANNLSDLTDLTTARTNLDVYSKAEVNSISTFDRDRANHTGTQLASTISDFNTQVRTSTLNQMALPTTDLNINNFKLINVATPTLATDGSNKAYADTKIAKVTSTNNAVVLYSGTAGDVKHNPNLTFNDVNTLTIIQANNATAFDVQKTGTGAGDVYKVTDNGTGTSFLIDKNGGNGFVLRSLQNSLSGSSIVQESNLSNDRAGLKVENASGNAITGINASIFQVVDFASTNTAPSVLIRTVGGADAIKVEQLTTPGRGVFVDQNTNETGLEIDSEATTESAIEIDHNLNDGIQSVKVLHNGVNKFAIERDNTVTDAVTLKLGNYYLWIDSTGRLRVKNGQPTTDTDGTIVGTQS